jgi:hypothetical protein
MIDLRQNISRDEMGMLFHDNDIWRSIVTDEGDMIMVQVWLGIHEVSEKYMEYHDNWDYWYFYWLFSEMLTTLVDSGVIQFYKKIDDPDYPSFDEEVMLYLKSQFREEIENAIFRLKIECGPFQLYYSKEKVSLFQKIYFNPGWWLCRKWTLECLLRYIDKISASGVKIQDFIDWMELEEKYIFYNWEFLIFSIWYSSPKNIAKMYAYFARFMTEEERENFHFELLVEKNVVYDNSVTQFKWKFQNYYYKIEEMGNDVEWDAIDNFIEEINHLKFLASEWVLESSKQSDLITRMRSFKYQEITDNNIFLLKVKKLLQSSTQTIYTDRHGWFSSVIHQFIQDWDNLFREFKWKKETDDDRIDENIREESAQIEIWELSNELRLEKSTWKIFRWNLKVYELNPDTASFKFLEYLMDNKWSILKYEDIKKHVNPQRMNTTDSEYCRKLKDSLDESIRKHIKAKRIGFMFDTE